MALIIKFLILNLRGLGVSSKKFKNIKIQTSNNETKTKIYILYNWEKRS